MAKFTFIIREITKTRIRVGRIRKNVKKAIYSGKVKYIYG